MPAERTGAGYETSDVPPRAVIYGMLAVLGLLVVSAAVVALMLYGFSASDGPAGPLREARRPPPAPRLEVDPKGDADRVRSAAEKMLHGFGWADREKGLARIPIDRAIGMTAARGWPDQPPPGESR
jgi:hypothetical protein